MGVCQICGGRTYYQGLCRLHFWEKGKKDGFEKLALNTFPIPGRRGWKKRAREWWHSVARPVRQDEVPSEAMLLGEHLALERIDKQHRRFAGVDKCPHCKGEPKPFGHWEYGRIVVVCSKCEKTYYHSISR